MLGRIYRQFGVYDKAQRLLEQALASGEQAFGAEHLRDRPDPQRPRCGADREGRLRRRRARRSNGRSRCAAICWVPSTLMWRSRWSSSGAFTRIAASTTAPSRCSARRCAIRRRVLGDEHRETAVSMSGLASVLRLNGDLDGAEALLRRSLELNRKTRGERHANTGNSLHDLGLIATARHDYAAAETLFRQSMDILRQALGETHPLIATGLNNLAHVWMAQGRYDEAANALQSAIDIARPALGADHQLVGDLHRQSRGRATGSPQARAGRAAARRGAADPLAGAGDRAKPTTHASRGRLEHRRHQTPARATVMGDRCASRGDERSGSCVA